MIKMQFTGGSPHMYQIDRSYNLPSITGAVQWNGSAKRFEVSNGSGWMPIDSTVEMQVSGPPDIWEMHKWIEEKKKEEANVKALRNKYPALDEAYNHLELIKALVISGPEVQNESDVQSSP